MDLRLKFFVPLIAFGVLLIAAITLFIVPRFLAEAHQHERAHNLDHLSTLGQALGESIVAGDLGQIHETLGNVLATLPEWRALQVTDSRQRILYPLTARPAAMPGGDWEVLRQPIMWQKEHLGEIELTYDLSAQKARETALLQQLVGTIVVALVLITAIGAMALEWTARRPVNQLALAAARLAQGDFSASLPPPARDEIGALVHGFAAMRDSIRKQQRTLEENAQDLEERVARRTADLARSNSTLQDTLGELEVARDAALEAARAKSEFLATMGHEIRTPLNGVIGTLSIMQGWTLALDQRELVTAAYESANTLLGLLNNVLDYSRIETGRLVLEQVEFDPRNIAEQVIELFVGPASEKHLDLSCVVMPGLPARVTGDPMRLRQVLTNLVHNAVKFTDHGGVSVRTEVIEWKGDRVRLRIEVRDTGVGIAPEAQKRIFNAFVQEDSSTTRRFGGSGLGLAIAQQLVEMMGGELGVVSRPGEGSTFWFAVPLHAAGARGIERVPAAVAGQRVLIVEENPLTRAALVEQLQSWGIAAGTCGQGELRDCLHQAGREGHPFTTVLARGGDQSLCGKALAQQLREDGGMGAAHLGLMCSGRVGSPCALRFGSGPDSCLHKPVRADELWAFLRSPDTESRTEPGETTATVQRQAGRRVLLVEDNSINRIVTAGMLLRLGYEVDIASDGAAAMRFASAGGYDAILVDLRMPGMDGFDVTRRLRSQEHGERRPRIVGITAGDVDAEMQCALAAGMDDCIGKPLAPQVLQLTLDRWLSGTVANRQG